MQPFAPDEGAQKTLAEGIALALGMGFIVDARSASPSEAGMAVDPAPESRAYQVTVEGAGAPAGCLAWAASEGARVPPDAVVAKVAEAFLGATGHAGKAHVVPWVGEAPALGGATAFAATDAAGKPAGTYRWVGAPAEDKGGIPREVIRRAEFQDLGAAGILGASVGDNVEVLLDVSMAVVIELGRTRLTVEEVLSLRPGSIVELDMLAGEPVDVLVNGVRLARGEIVVVDENFGVRLTEIVGTRENRRTDREAAPKATAMAESKAA